MKLNTDKCHFLVSGSKYEHSCAKKAIIKSEKVTKLNFKAQHANKLKFDG